MAIAAYKKGLANTSLTIVSLLIIVFSVKFIDYETQKLAEYFPWRCPWHFFLNFNCPGCGILRSIIEALKLNFNKSLTQHVLGIPVIAISVFLYTQHKFALDRWISFFDQEFKNKSVVFWILTLGLIYNFIYKNINLFF